MEHLIWLSSLSGLPPQKAWALLSAFRTAEGVFRAPVDELAAVIRLTPAERLKLRMRALSPAQNILARCKRLGISLLAITDPAYPERLKNIYDPPLLLYVRGELPQWSTLPAIAVVGTRHCTPYGATVAERMGYRLSESGCIVVSGMALGIDSAAHRGALRGRTPTVAVFGTAIDGCYPAANAALLRDILRHGAAVSEYPPGAKATRGSFPRRNRIMSGLCLGVLVAEAPARSGALITAAMALDQGRDVFAVPGAIDAPASAGANELIQNGARLVRDVSDILTEYQAVFPFTPPPEDDGPPLSATVAAAYDAPPKPAQPKPAPAEAGEQPAPARPRPRPPAQTALGGALLDALSDGPLTLEVLLERTGRTATEALAELTLLELQGKLRQYPGHVFERIGPRL